MQRAHSAILLLSISCCLGAATRSVRDGVYTKEQAARGKNTYGEVCSKCHGANLAGGEDAPALGGDEFLRRWNGKNAAELFGLIRKTMPTDDPGGLSRREYADTVAYIFGANDFPAGPKELSSDDAALSEIRIENGK